MRTARFFCDITDQNTSAVLTDTQFHHLVKVLRLKTGDTLELFNGKGTVASAVIDTIEKNLARLTIKDVKTFPQPVNNRIIIASSIAKGERFELLVAKCTELGVDRIIPVIFERTVKQSLQHHRLESIAVESAKQSHRLFLPAIDVPASFDEIVRKLPSEYPDAKFVFGSLTENTESVINLSFSPNDCIAFIGPEGGLTETEEAMLQKINARPVSLAGNVLRIETAAIAFAAILTAKRISEK